MQLGTQPTTSASICKNLDRNRNRRWTKRRLPRYPSARIVPWCTEELSARVQVKIGRMPPFLSRRPIQPSTLKTSQNSRLGQSRKCRLQFPYRLHIRCLSLYSNLQPLCICAAGHRQVTLVSAGIVTTLAGAVGGLGLAPAPAPVNMPACLCRQSTSLHQFRSVIV